jgi:hypothetical protein
VFATCGTLCEFAPKLISSADRNDPINAMDHAMRCWQPFRPDTVVDAIIPGARSPIMSSGLESHSHRYAMARRYLLGAGRSIGSNPTFLAWTIRSLFSLSIGHRR